MTLVKIMKPGKGHEESEMTPAQIMELMCKLGKSRFIAVNTSTNEVIRDMSTIKETDTITIMPVVAGGAE